MKGARVTKQEAAWIGWTKCPKCDAQFLGVFGVRLRCRQCRHEFECDGVSTVPDLTFETAPGAAPGMLLRVEMWCARRWAEAKAAVDMQAPDYFPGKVGPEIDISGDVGDWLRAWIQVRGLRMGQHISFYYGRGKPR